MTIKEAKQVLEEIINADFLRISGHCGDRLRDRNVSTQDIEYLLMTGIIIRAERQPEFGEYSITIQGKDLDGEPLTMEAALIVGERRVLCKTVY
jgi:hypothetical protein